MGLVHLVAILELSLVLEPNVNSCNEPAFRTRMAPRRVRLMLWVGFPGKHLSRLKIRSMEQCDINYEPGADMEVFNVSPAGRRSHWDTSRDRVPWLDCLTKGHLIKYSQRDKQDVFRNKSSWNTDCMLFGGYLDLDRDPSPIAIDLRCSQETKPSKQHCTPIQNINSVLVPH